MLDILLIVFSIFSIWLGFQRGLIIQVFHLLGFFLSYFVAYQLYQEVAVVLQQLFPIKQFMQYPFLTNLIYNSFSFIFLFFIVKWLLQFVAIMLNQLAHFPGLSLINRTGGAIIGLAQFLIIITILIHIFSLPNLPWPKVHQYINNSYIAQTILDETSFLRTKFLEMLSVKKINNI